MLNEPVGEGGDAPEVGDMGAAGEEGAPVNYIQVTPQEKEAIERVSELMWRVSISGSATRDREFSNVRRDDNKLIQVMHLTLKVTDLAPGYPTSPFSLLPLLAC